MIINKNITLILLCLSIMLYGCSLKFGPMNNAEFTRVENIKQLEGIYKNIGEGNKEYSSYIIYLSSIIWPNDKAMDHSSIESVEIRTTNNVDLMAIAHGKDDIKKQTVFIRNKDFKISSGRIILARVVSIAGFREGEAMLGIYGGQIEIGLDKNGQGKYRTKGSVVGLAFCVMPIAMNVREDIRFVKIKE